MNNANSPRLSSGKKKIRGEKWADCNSANVTGLFDGLFSSATVIASALLFER
jgi:hypothetical protein